MKLRQRRRKYATLDVNCKHRQRSSREIFVRMVIERVGKSKEKHQRVRFILSAGMQRREETPREKSVEYAPATKTCFL